MRKSSLAALLVLLCLPHVLAGSEKKQPKDYALIYGTVFGPNDAPIEGVRILIRKVDEKKPKYDRTSDIRGEFAQRVPPGPAVYIVYPDSKSPLFGKHSKIKPGKEVTVHIDKNERQDISLHLVQ